MENPAFPDAATVRQALAQFSELGGAEFVAEMIDLLQQQTPRQFKDIDSSLASGDLTEATRHAHSMKSSFGSFGAISCQELAAQMNLAGKNGDIESYRQSYAHLKTEYVKLLELLQSARQ